MPVAHLYAAFEMRLIIFSQVDDGRRESVLLAHIIRLYVAVARIDLFDLIVDLLAHVHFDWTSYIS